MQGMVRNEDHVLVHCPVEWAPAVVCDRLSTNSPTNSRPEICPMNNPINNVMQNRRAVISYSLNDQSKSANNDVMTKFSDVSLDSKCFMCADNRCPSSQIIAKLILKKIVFSRMFQLSKACICAC